jgi:flavin-dependent dehydrogenase
MAARTAVFSHFNDAGNSQVDRYKIEVHVVDESNAWLWLIPLANDCVSVGMVSSLEKANEFQLNESDNFVGFLKNFKGIEKRFKKTEALRAVDQLSGFSVAVKKKYGEGYVLCGNSTEFLDPIFSSGVALATKSALLAAKAVERKLTGEQVDWSLEYEMPISESIDVFRSYIKAWYEGDLQKVFFAEKIDPTIKNQICSVLAGHVRDTTNPFVKKHKTIIKTLAKVLEIQNRK